MRTQRNGHGAVKALIAARALAGSGVFAQAADMRVCLRSGASLADVTHGSPKAPVASLRELPGSAQGTAFFEKHGPGVMGAAGARS